MTAALVAAGSHDDAGSLVDRFAAALARVDAPLAEPALQAARGFLASGAGEPLAAARAFAAAAELYKSARCDYEASLAMEQASDPAMSGDGRFVAFQSSAATLVPGDTNNTDDVFVHDRVTGANERVSVAGDGAQSDGYSGGPAISADGRYVGFPSGATNLVPGDTNTVWDVFVHDRNIGATERVSVSADGTEANQTSGSTPALSADGRKVAFVSSASNLVPGDTNGQSDVFVRVRGDE